MNIQEWKKILDKKETEDIKARLVYALDNIRFLESIYMTGGEHHHYSEELNDAAYRDRQEACQFTSACYSVLRSRGLTEEEIKANG